MLTPYDFVKTNLSKTNYKNVIIESILDFGDKYCVAYSPKQTRNGEGYVDSFLSVNKRSGEVGVFNPLMDVSMFRKVATSPVYKRGGLSV